MDGIDYRFHHVTVHRNKIVLVRIAASNREQTIGRTLSGMASLEFIFIYRSINKFVKYAIYLRIA